MLVIRKAAPPQHHGTALSATEQGVARQLGVALEEAGSKLVVGTPERTAAEFVARLQATEGWQAFVAALTDRAGAETRTPLAKDAGGTLIGEFDLLDTDSVTWARSHSAALIKYIEDNSRENVNKLVGRSLRGRLTVDQLERRLRKVVTLTPRQVDAVNRAAEAAYVGAIKAGKSVSAATAIRETVFDRQWAAKLKIRTRLISRTELSNANNAGHFIGMATGIKDGWIHPDTVKEWSTAEDERTCPICRPMNGEIVRWDKKFSNGLMMPPAHPGCRCSFNTLPPDYPESDFSPLATEEQLYGDKITPQPVSPSYEPPDLSTLGNLFETETQSAARAAAAGRRAAERAERAAARAARRELRREKLKELIHENRLEIAQHLADALDGNYGEDGEYEVEVNGFAISVGPEGTTFGYSVVDQRAAEAVTLIGQLRVTPEGELEATGPVGEAERIVLDEVGSEQEQEQE